MIIKRMKVFESDHPENVFCYSPCILKTFSGNLIVTLDLGGPGVEFLDGVKGSRDNGKKFGQGKVFILEKGRKYFRFVTNFPFWHARIIETNEGLYIIGHAGDLMIIKSTDNGLTWSKPCRLTQNQKWHAAPCNHIVYGDYIYFTMEQRRDLSIEGWNTSGLSPFILKCPLNKDLLCKDNWIISNIDFVFNQNILKQKTDYFGYPFYNESEKKPVNITKSIVFSPSGWLEGNIAKIYDKDHIWYNKDSFHVLMRSSIGLTNYACLIKFTEKNDNFVPNFEKTAFGKNMVFLNIPGGHLKFHINYDQKTKLYWMVSSQSTDSAVKPDVLESIQIKTKRYNLPDNERNRLQLSFSKNLVDWCFAGIIYVGKNDLYSRNYPCFIFVDNDIYLVTKGGNSKALNSKYGNIIELFIIKNFRELVY